MENQLQQRDFQDNAYGHRLEEYRNLRLVQEISSFSPMTHLSRGDRYLRVEFGERSFNPEVIEDHCAIELRGKNLAGLPWLSCRPPIQKLL